MHKIMLVDDVAISNIILKKLLNKLSIPMEIFEFTDAKAALSELERIEPDFIFLDLNMPGIDGFSFLDSMQQNDQQHKVIITTSSTSNIDKEKAGTYSNVMRYFTKPMDLNILSDILQPA